MLEEFRGVIGIFRSVLGRFRGRLFGYPCWGPVAASAADVTAGASAVVEAEARVQTEDRIHVEEAVVVEMEEDQVEEGAIIVHWTTYPMVPEVGKRTIQRFPRWVTEAVE